MQLVIEIDKKVFDYMKECSFVENTEVIMHQSIEDRIKTLMLFDMIDSIKNGKPLPNGEWIPVTERLPKKCEYGEVLVTYIPSGGTLWTTVIIAHYSDLMGIAKPSFHIGEVGKESFQNITKQVIAWMPLPEPYTEVEDGKDTACD